MAYAQKNYPQIQGINGRYPISAIGCFITAFCNLEEGFGKPVDPLTLNNYFVRNNTFIDVDDGVRDDLGWNSVTAFDGATKPNITVDHGTNQTAGWPDTNDAIVRFHYQSISHPFLPNGQPNMIFHFCKVYNWQEQLIMDSWDGQVKKSPYGSPTAWATYTHDNFIPYITLEQLDQLYQQLLHRAPDAAGIDHYVGHYALDYVVNDIKNSNEYKQLNAPKPVPAPAPPKPAPPLPPVPIPTSTEKYSVVTSVPGYTNATKAANHMPPTGDITVAPGAYYIFNTYPGRNDLINVTKTLGQSGAWINKADNVDKPVVVSPTPTNIPEVPKVPLAHDWHKDYVPFPSPVQFLSTHAQTIKDLDGEQPDMPLPAYDEDASGKTVGVVKAYGTVNKEGVDYYRLRLQTDTDFKLWYCVSKFDPTAGTPNLLRKPIITSLNTKPSIFQEVESVFPQLLDDILPSWFKKQKVKEK